MSCGSGFAGSMCELFVPTVGVGARLEALKDFLSGRFPFSLASSLGSFFDGAAGSPAALPTDVAGFITLPWSDPGMLAFFGVVKVVVTVFIGAGFAWYLLDRFTPQVTI